MRFHKSYFYVLIVLLLLLTACKSAIIEVPEIPDEQKIEVVEENKPIKGGEMVISFRNPKTLNPLLNEDQSVNEVLKILFDTLITFDDQLKPIPHLAESWELSQESTVLTVALRSDIVWHDGMPLTAQDVVFSLDTIRKSQPTSVYKKCIQNISHYAVVDDHTIKIVFNQPFSGAVYALYFPIIPAHYYSNEDVLVSSKNMQPVGTGSYKFAAFTSMKALQLKANEKWFRGEPFIENIKVIVTPDHETDLHALEQQQLDLVATDVIDWGKYSEMDKTKIYEYTTSHFDFIGWNFNLPIFQDLSVRQAMAYGINKQAMVEEYYLGHGFPVDAPIHPKSWLYDESIKKYTYAPDTAKQLLLQAGWIDSDGDEILDKDINNSKNSLSFRVLVNKENVQRMQIAYDIQAKMKNLGIEILVDEQPYDIYVEKLETKDFDTFIGGWRLSLIPDYTFAFHSSQIETGSNFISYRSPEMDRLLQQAFLAVGEQEMKKSYIDLQKYIVQELPYLSLYFRTAAVITNDQLKGDLQPHIDSIYTNIEKWYIQKKSIEDSTPQHENP